MTKQERARAAVERLKERYPDRVIEIVDTRGAALGEGLIALFVHSVLRPKGLV